MLAVAPGVAGEVPETLPGGWRLDWNDEFTGSKLDTDKWRPELGVIRNRDAVQTYTKDCVKVRGGKLILISKARETRNSNYDPKKEHWTHQLKSMPYASGSVTTRDVKHFTLPGRLEIRAKVPRAKGVWPRPPCRNASCGLRKYRPCGTHHAALPETHGGP